MQPSTVLFLAANPAATQALQLGEECRAIEDKIRKAKFRDQIRFRSRWAARPDDLLEALNEDAPKVLHFSGHGAGDQGLCFQSEDGGALRVATEVLAQIMRAAGASVMLVVLNACYSEVQAEVLVAHVPCVIGMSDAIGDKAAIIYAGSFYRALASGMSVANAHEQGVVSLGLPPSGGQTRHVKPAGVVPCAATPRLLTRSDVDANCIYLVHEPGNHVVIVIEATLSDFNEDMLARITQELRRWTDDLSLRITKVEKGSVRLTIALVPAAARTLMELRRNGRLSRICGFEISAMFELQATEMAAQAAADDARMVALGRQRHAVVRRVVGGTELPDRTEVDSRHQALDLESVLMNAEPALRRLAKRLCGDNVDAHDLLQDTFERVLRQGILPDVSNPVAWLCTIMNRLFIDRCRVAARLPNHELLEDKHRNIAELESEELDCSKITVDDIRDALGAIEPVYREVYVLHTFEHLSYEQIAERLSIELVTVGTRLTRARKKLRTVLAKRFGLGDES